MKTPEETAFCNQTKQIWAEGASDGIIESSFEPDLCKKRPFIFQTRCSCNGNFRNYGKQALPI